MLMYVQFETLKFTVANECPHYAVVMTVEQNVKMHNIFSAMLDVCKFIAILGYMVFPFSITHHNIEIRSLESEHQWELYPSIGKRSQRRVLLAGDRFEDFICWIIGL